MGKKEQGKGLDWPKRSSGPFFLYKNGPVDRFSCTSKSTPSIQSRTPPTCLPPVRIDPCRGQEQLADILLHQTYVMMIRIRIVHLVLEIICQIVLFREQMMHNLYV